MFQTKFEETIKTHMLCSVNVFFFENLVVYEVTWKYMAKQGRPQTAV